MHTDAESLGKLEETFKPSLANVAAGVILGLGLVIGGIALAVYIALKPAGPNETSGDHFAKYAIMAVGGLLLPLMGGALVFGMRELAAHRVLLHEHGFQYLSGKSVDVCHWQDVTEIREVFTHEELKVAKLPGAKIKQVSRSFVVLRSDGKEFGFDGNSINRLTHFGEWLKYASGQFEIPWREVETK